MSVQFFQCPNCKAANTSDSRFCSSCDLSFVQPSQLSSPLPPRKKRISRKKKNRIRLWIAFGVIELCLLFGLFGPIKEMLWNQSSTAPIANTSTTASEANNSAPDTPPSTFAELKARSEQLLKMEHGSEYPEDDLKQYAAFLVLLRQIPEDAKEFSEAKILIDELIKKSSVIEDELLVLGKKPVNSEWDGSVAEVDQYLKDALPDYEISEYVYWTKVSKTYLGKEPYWETKLKIKIKYRRYDLKAFDKFLDLVFYMQKGKVVKTEGLCESKVEKC